MANFRPKKGQDATFASTLNGHNSAIFYPSLTLDHTKMTSLARQIECRWKLSFFVPLFAPRPHMGGGIGFMDPKPPSSCWYISWSWLPTHGSKVLGLNPPLNIGLFKNSFFWKQLSYATYCYIYGIHMVQSDKGQDVRTPKYQHHIMHIAHLLFPMDILVYIQEHWRTASRSSFVLAKWFMPLCLDYILHIAAVTPKSRFNLFLCIT